MKDRVMDLRILPRGLVCLALASCVAGTSLPAKAVTSSFPGAFIQAGVLPENALPYPEALILVSDDDHAKVGKGATAFIGDMGERAIGFLSDSSMTTEQKRASFRKLLQESFDMKTIGRFSLGRYWRVASPEQRKEYQDLFENMVINVYSQRFSDYQGQNFETRGFRSDGPSDAIVTSFIVPDNGPEVQVDWRVRYKNDQYRIIDVIVEGVSMSVTQRSDFSSVIQRGGGDVQVLLNHLRSL